MQLKKYLAIVLSSVVWLVALPALAQTKIVNPFPMYGTMEEFIYALIELVFLFGVPLLTVAIIYGGYKIVTAQGDERKLEEGKQVVLWTLVGAAIILGARVIAGVVKGTAQPFLDAVK